MTPASPMALAAVRAYRNIGKWGFYAAMRYCEKRGARRHFLAVIGFELVRQS